MATATAVKIYEMSDIEGFDGYAEQISAWSSLWWGDFEEAGIERCFVAFDGGKPIGFQTISIDGRCVAIEVHSDYQGQGIASVLVEASGCYRPEQNECPEFWAAMEERHG